MKKSINLLCVLILTLLVFSCLSTLYSMGYSFGSGLRMGYNACESNVIPMAVAVKNPIQPGISSQITDANGNTYHTMWESGICFLPESGHSLAIAIAGSLLFIAMFIFGIRIIVMFVKFIININRGAIFDRKNVSRLDKIGIDLLLISLCSIIQGILQEIELHNVLPVFEGFTLVALWSIPWSAMIMAFVARLAAQIMRKAIILHEEQSLTV